MHSHGAPLAIQEQLYKTLTHYDQGGAHHDDHERIWHRGTSTHASEPREYYLHKSTLADQ